MVDRLNTTSTAVLGLTLGCCQCHSHKYDPFTQAEYYQLYAFFNNVEPKNTEIEGTVREQARYQAAADALSERRQALDASKKLLEELKKHKSFLAWRGDQQEKAKHVISALALPQELSDALLQPDGHPDVLADFWSSLEGRIDDVNKAKASAVRSRATLAQTLRHGLRRTSPGST